MRKWLATLLKQDKGATAIEYGLLVALMALAALVAITSLANKTTGMWSKVRSNVDSVM